MTLTTFTFLHWAFRSELCCLLIAHFRVSKNYGGRIDYRIYPQMESIEGSWGFVQLIDFGQGVRVTAQCKLFNLTFL